MKDSEISSIVFDIQKGLADPADARNLMRCFIDAFDTNAIQRTVLLEHFRDAFKRYLDGKQTLESSLGLARKKGKPTTNELDQIKIAASVLDFRMKGLTYEKAVAETMSQMYRERTVVTKAWKTYRLDAIAYLANKKRISADTYPWTQDEKAALCKIFKDNPLFIGSQK